MEEAGLDAVLDGIYRFEFSSEDGFVRFRVIWAAHQRDESLPLKTVADDETYGAEWFTVKEVISLAKKSPKMLQQLSEIPRIKAQRESGVRERSKEKIRGNEIILMFNWAEKGTKVFNSRLYYGEDGDEINNKIVEVKTYYNIVVVFKSLDYDESTNLAVRSFTLDKPFEDFTKEADDFIKRVKKSNSKQLGKVKLENFCGVHHIAPKTVGATATMSLCFYATVLKPKKTTKNTFFSGNEKIFSSCKAHELFALTNVQDNILAPLEMLAFEGSEHEILE